MSLDMKQCFYKMPFLLNVQLGRFSRLGRLRDKTLTVLERWAFLAYLAGYAP
jgi:hypothetical protein